MLQIRVVTSTAIHISTGAKAFLELNSAAIHFVSSCWIPTKCRANESRKKSFWMRHRTSSSNQKCERCDWSTYAASHFASSHCIHTKCSASENLQNELSNALLSIFIWQKY
jgi:hypothetical protein